MARWKLAAPHYIYVPGTKWEYSEISRSTGRPTRQTFAVPRYLHPEDPADWTEITGRDEGMIIVCHPGKGQGRDIEFTNPAGDGPGDPTPDMIPVDDEARQISAGFAMKWKHPIESLSTTYGDKLLEGLESEVAQVQAQAPAAIEGMTELLAAIGGMMKQNQEILATIVPRGQRRA